MKNIETKHRETKFIYSADELSTYLMDTLNKCFINIIERPSTTLIETRYLYDDINGFTTDSSYIYSVRYLSRSRSINKENYLKVLSNISKKNKKRINRILFKLNRNINNPTRLVKLLNFIESISGNRNKFTLSIYKEELIEEKRNRYKELIKYIKMDLQTELNKAREEYKKEKGDYYIKKTIEVKSTKKDKQSIFDNIKNLFKKSH